DTACCSEDFDTALPAHACKTTQNIRLRKRENFFIDEKIKEIKVCEYLGQMYAFNDNHGEVKTTFCDLHLSFEDKKRRLGGFLSSF
ncbi:MAG: hypothetical protein SOR67_00545, partial [Alloprevotella sp.]|nr:hypothetical protein [Alloprevotella sp.]